MLLRVGTLDQTAVVGRQVAERRLPPRRVWGMLALRSAVSLMLLLAVALAYALLGRPDPVAAASAWWLWFVTAANVASIALMVRFARLEGLRLRDVYFFDRATWRGDLVWAGVFAVGVVLSLQHLFYSMRLDWRYDLWLAVKFLPFALWTGYVVDRRPTALPYLMVLHFSIDVSLPVLLLLVSRGMALG